MAVLIWDLAVTLSIIGFGFTALRVLGLRNRPVALAGITGLAVVLLLGGWLNLANLLRTRVFVTLVALGIACLLFEGLRSREQVRERLASVRIRAGQLQTLDLVLLGAGLLTILLLILEPVRQIVWNNDDVTGYVPLAIKALQLHSLQSDPFCDRRISSSVGGGIFLDSLMYVTHALRSMAFIDSGLGVMLYAAGVWALGRLARLSVGARGLLLLCIPVATLMKVNLTPVYLSAGGFIALLLLFAQQEAGEKIGWRHSVVIGMIAGALTTLKSTNIVFLGVFITVLALLFWRLRPGAAVFRYFAAALPAAAFFVLPWSLNQHKTEGTYLYPLLGKGFYASAYGFLPSLQTPYFLSLGVIIALPATLLLCGGVLFAWKRTTAYPVALRAAVIAYFAAAVLSTPITGAGLAGDSVDRYTAPFVMPGFLLLGLIALAPLARGEREPARSRRFPFRVTEFAFFAICALYVTVFLGLHEHWYQVEGTRLAQLVGAPTQHLKPYERVLDAQATQAHLSKTEQIQAAVPRGATMLASLSDATALDFDRQHILIAEYPGMVGPPPGMPIDAGPAALLAYLRSQGVGYVAYDRALIDTTMSWPEHPKTLRYPHSVGYYFVHFGMAHNLQPLGLEQLIVSQHVGEQLRQLAQEQPVVFDDGNVFVMSLSDPSKEHAR